jgi:AcrR family transcriptional regulator
MRSSLHFLISCEKGGPVALADLLAERRPHRADAARNFDAILAAGRIAFAAGRADVSLDEIARQAGVGVATLYRNFPSREDLVEAVYVTEVDELCRYGERLATRGDPWDALVSWLRRFVGYLGAKRILLDALDRESGAFRACRDALYVTGEPLLARAQQAGRARAEVTVDDVLRFFLGVASAPVSSRRQRDRFLAMAIAGLAA